MAIITLRYDIGDYVFIKTPRIWAQVVGVVYTGFNVTYRVLYWVGQQPVYYEAYDYELNNTEKEESLEEDELSSEN